LSHNPLEITRAVAAVENASRAIEDWYESRPVDAAPDIHAEWEQEAEELAGLERCARHALIQLLVQLEPVTPIAVVLGDGTIVAYSDNGDGLAIVQAERIHRA
jgi:hypothetical protein